VTQRPLATVYTRLYDHYGPQHWWPADTPFEIVVGAILTQATAWRNVELALARLKERGLLEPSAMRQASPADLEEAIRPAGYFRAKAQTLRGVLALLEDHYGGSLDRMLQAPAAVLREQLLRVRGIGPETADAILLYAAGHPVFVIDAYTVRMVSRAALVPPGELAISACRRRFTASCPATLRSTANTTPLLSLWARTAAASKGPAAAPVPSWTCAPTARRPRPLLLKRLEIRRGFHTRM